MYRATYASFEFLPFLELAEFAHIHSQKLTAQALVFPNPDYTPAQIETSSTNLRNAHSAYESNHGDTEHTALLAAQSETVGQLKRNADYVSKVANGDKTLIESVNFTATKDKTQPVKLPYYAKPGEKPNTIDCFYIKDKDTVSIVWMFYKKQDTMPPFNEISFRGVSAEKYTMDGLSSVTLYNVFAAPIKRKSDGKLNFTLINVVNVP